MTHFEIITSIPNLFNDFKNSSIIKKAIDNNKININIIDLRQFAEDKHKKIDDYPVGGGPGMVLKVDVIHKALQSIKKMPNNRVILLSPQGNIVNQTKINYFAKNYNQFILICGHYEGVDERVYKYIDEEISIGDFVLTGGEIPAMVLIDSIARLVEDVIKEESWSKESFQSKWLDYPNYTKPKVYDGQEIPNILYSGHHKNIDEWRLEQSIKNTINKKNYLLKNIKINKKEQEIINKLERNKND